MSAKAGVTRTTTHTMTIHHDAESHAYDCHDDCTVTLACSGVTDACRCWWECTTCHDASQEMDTAELDDFNDHLHEAGEAHGVEHQHIDGKWMTPTVSCITQMLDHDASYLVGDLPEGTHEVDLDCDEGFVHVMVLDGAS